MLIMKSLDYMAPPGPALKYWLQKMAKKTRNFRTMHAIFAIKMFRVTLSTIFKQVVLL